MTPRIRNGSLEREDLLHGHALDWLLPPSKPPCRLGVARAGLGLPRLPST